MRKTGIIIFFLLTIFSSFGQNNSSFQLHTLSDTSEAAILDTLWKFHDGDDQAWSSETINDDSWLTAKTTLDTADGPHINFSGIGWFRLHISVPKQMQHIPLALGIGERGASEIYLDGKLLNAFGHPDKDGGKEKKYTPSVPFIFQFGDSTEHVLAIKYSFHSTQKNTKKGFTVTLRNANTAVQASEMQSKVINIFTAVLCTFFFTLAFIHFLLFLFYRRQSSNLFYSIFILLFGMFFFIPLLMVNSTNPDNQEKLSDFLFFITPFFCTALLGFIYSLFYPGVPRKFLFFLGVLILVAILNFLEADTGLFVFIFICATTVTSLIEVFLAIYKKKKGAWVVGTATLSFLLLVVVLLTKNALGYGTGLYINHLDIAGILLITLLILILLSIPLSMSVYLAREFAGTNKHLSKKLIEVEELSAKTIEQEKEKQKILETQKEILEVQVQERTHEIVEQKKLIEEKNKDITDSINYAKRIQDAILPAKELKYKIFSNAFIMFKPKDIVSGDFYWFAEKDGRRLIASCDCTGHGVPGALMSMIGNNILNQIVLENGITSPEKILGMLNKEIRKALKQDGHEATKDGMDIALVSFVNENEIEFAGAQRPLWIISNGELNEIKGDKFSIGGLQNETEKTFQKHSRTLAKNDCLYLFSDGYVDQFGGTEGKKFMSKQFKQLLMNNCWKSAAEQEKVLDDAIESWKGTREQIDDILVIGIKIL